MSARELLVRFGGKVDPSLKSSGAKASREISGVADTAERTSKRTRGALGGIGSGLRAVVGVAAAAAAGMEVVGLAGDAIAEAREAQKVGATTAQIIKATGGAAKVTADQVGALAERISNKTGVDDEAVQSAANLLLTFKQVRNEAGKGSQIFDRATAAAQDLAAAGFGDANGAAKMLGKALNDPTKGISALGRAGVTFTEAQKKQIKALQASGDMLGAQKIIMAEVEGQVGGVAEKTATAGEKMRTMWGNTKEQLGTMLLPLIDKFAGVMTTTVLPGVQGFLSMVERQGPALGSTFEPFLSSLREVPGFLDRTRERARPFFEYLSQLATGLAEGFRVHILPAVSELAVSFSSFAATVRPIVAEIVTWVMARFSEWAPTIKGYMRQITQTVGDSIRLVAAVIGRGTQVIRYVWDRWGQGILRTGTTVFGGIVRAVGGALNIVQGIVRTVLAVVKGDWSGAWSAVQQILRGALQVITGVMRGGMAVVTGLAGAARDVLGRVWASARDAAVRRFGELRDGIARAVGQARDSAVAKARAVKDGVVRVFDGVKGAIAKKFEGLASSIASPLRTASGWLNRNVLSPMNAVTSKFGVSIPQIPKFHSGGVVPGRRELGAILLGGEGVLSRRGMDTIGGEDALHALNQGRLPCNAGGFGKILDWVKKPAKWAADVAKSGIAWGLGKLFDAGAGVAGQYPPPMAGPLLARALGKGKAAALKWAKGKDQAESFGDASTVKFGPTAGGRAWPTTTRRLSGNYPGHSGIDIPVPVGTPMYAAANGVITYTGWGKGYGNAIFANLAGMPAVYGHGSRPMVKPGDQVRAGQVIGLSGNTGRSTGPHVHFEVAPGGFARPGNRALTLRWLGYDSGGWLAPGVTPTVNNTGRPEAVLTADQWERLFSALEGLANGDRSVVVDGHSLRDAIRSEVRAAVRTVREEALR